MGSARHIPGIGRVRPKRGFEFKADGTVRLKDGWEVYEGEPQRVVNGDRIGWWRFHDDRDRDGYCDNPARGY
jgi:hypothetical protein